MKRYTRSGTLALITNFRQAKRMHTFPSNDSRRRPFGVSLLTLINTILLVVIPAIGFLDNIAFLFPTFAPWREFFVWYNAALIATSSIEYLFAGFFLGPSIIIVTFAAIIGVWRGSNISRIFFLLLVICMNIPACMFFDVLERQEMRWRIYIAIAIIVINFFYFLLPQTSAFYHKASAIHRM
jgi:hypothetical protein